MRDELHGAGGLYTSRRSVVQTQTTIAFLGQCQTSGYPGVPAEATFPQVCRRALEARRPNARVDVVIEEYQHPAELTKATERVLRTAPRVIVIEVVGWLAVKSRSAVDLSKLPRGIRSAYDRARHFRRVTAFVASKIPDKSQLIHRVQVHAHALASGLLQPILPRYPRPTIAEYEKCIDDAIARIQQVPETTVVVQGPGAPNLDLLARLPSDMPKRYRAVEEMARRVAGNRSTLYVDRWSTVSPRFFIPGSIRPHADGHTVWGNLLAEQLLASGLI